MEADQYGSPEVRSAQQRGTRRKPGSFVLRLTFGQFMRMLGVFLAVDLLVILLCTGLLLADLDYEAAGLASAPSFETARRIAALGDEVQVEIGSEPMPGIRLHEKIEELLDVMPGASRRLVLRSTEENPYLWGLTLTPEYGVSLEIGEGRYFTVTFDLSRRAGRFCSAILLLACVELLMLITNTAGVRRAVRRTLAPIQQLAAATRSIGVEQPPQPHRQGRPREEKPREKLELSGTIDTLNKITAKRLDTRISIDDERVELRGLAVAINSMLDRLDEAYSSQARFVSDASHELRTPIAVIQGYANLLDRWGKEDPAALQESIEAIMAEAEGMQALVEQLLFLARSDNNSIVMQLEPLDASALAAEVLRDTQLIDKTHSFVSDIEPGLYVEGDSGLLKQAMRVFVDNAVKYSPAGEVIRIGVKRSQDGVRVAVTDNGIGIPEEDVPHVFERFYRADDSRTRSTGGTGLGLSIAGWIVQRHGGHIELVSRKDIGTRLTMLLPAREAPLAPIVPDADVS